MDAATETEAERELWFTLCVIVVAACNYAVDASSVKQYPPQEDRRYERSERATPFKQLQDTIRSTGIAPSGVTNCFSESAAA